MLGSPVAGEDMFKKKVTLNPKPFRKARRQVGRLVSTSAAVLYGASRVLVSIFET